MGWKEGRGDAVPGRRRAPVYDLVYVLPNDPVDATILDATWLGIHTHWIPPINGHKSRTRLCQGEAGCPWCGPDFALQWNAYLGVWHHGWRRRAVLSLTELGIAATITVNSAPEGLRGQRLTFSRATTHKSSAVVVCQSASARVGTVPTAHDIWHTLTVVYGQQATDAVALRHKGKDGAK